MTSISVPSTLVKCLYLFFDLSEMDEAEDEANSTSEFTPKERRILLQKIFVQVRDSFIFVKKFHTFYFNTYFRY